MGSARIRTGRGGGWSSLQSGEIKILQVELTENLDHINGGVCSDFGHQGTDWKKDRIKGVRVRIKTGSWMERVSIPQRGIPLSGLTSESRLDKRRIRIGLADELSFFQLWVQIVENFPVIWRSSGRWCWVDSTGFTVENKRTFDVDYPRIGHWMFGRRRRRRHRQWYAAIRLSSEIHIRNSNQRQIKEKFIDIRLNE